LQSNYKITKTIIAILLFLGLISLISIKTTKIIIFLTYNIKGFT